MITADGIVIIVALLAVVSGALLGFGKVLKFFTGGIFGKVISVVACYLLFGIVLELNFVQDLLTRFNAYLVGKDNAFCDFLITIRADMIVFALALFAVVQCGRILIVNIVKNVMETDALPLKIINKAVGAILLPVLIAGLTLIVFQILYYVNYGFGESLVGSAFGLDKLFYNNPLLEIIEGFKS